MFRSLGLALLLTLAAGSTTAAEITPKAWKTFVDESWSQYGDKKALDFEDQLYEAATETKSQAAAIAEFARRMNLTPAQAEAYAELLVGKVSYFHACDGKCPLAPDAPLIEQARRTAMAEPTGTLLFDVARDADDREDAAAVIRLVREHAAALSIFVRLYDYGHKQAYLLAVLLAVSDNPSVPPPSIDLGFSGTPDEMSGGVAAILELTEARLADKPNAQAWRVAIARYALDQLLWLGFDHDAAEKYLGYPEALRQQLWLDTANANQTCQHVYADPFVNRLAAALWLSDHRDDARALLARTGASDTGMMHDLFEHNRSDVALFDLYIGGLPKPETPEKRSPCDSIPSLAGDGWLFAQAQASPAIRRLVHDRLAGAGYADMAQWLANQVPYADGASEPAILPRLADLVPADIKSCQDAWATRIAAARPTTTPKPLGGQLHVSGAAFSPHWTEAPLPAGVKAWNSAEKQPSLPKGLKLPIPADSVLRYEATGKDAAVIYASSQYDMAGEVGASGLWLVLRRDGTWQPPLYLGLQTYFPYVVTPGSHLPLLNGDHLNLEVQIREIDPKTIRFPPVATGYARQADGLYLDIPLADLRKDSDNDGLTDIEEARLGLKPDAVDSDGDGLPDGIDALPLTAFNPKTDPRDSAVAKLVLERLVGHDTAALIVAPHPEANSDNVILEALGKSPPHERRNTLILVSDIDLFSGITQAPFRLIVYSSKDLERLDRKAPFYPPELTQVFRSLDGNDYYVNWSAQWVGGAFRIHCEKDKCQISQTLSDWIT
ncbi:hypothetical protein [Asticcacaulis sp. 201]|uniref:hypothetical protein n=1 Tax=Asticcacaulis sp. 201 TaxID=3028787 RepID=UPI0029170073|nr:hypothetical protein [Asticcacaulis sp. 201]MDV6329938.1 hypothetical protein [Asticcacaulis sp. 201]